MARVLRELRNKLCTPIIQYFQGSELVISRLPGQGVKGVKKQAMHPYNSLFPRLRTADFQAARPGC